jgi:AmmeMemoRadiSam system protein A
MKDFLSPDEQQFLLRLARDTIEASLEEREAPNPKTAPKNLLKKRGAFVTLKVDDQLRGCIGYPLPYKPLAETVIEMAVAAATQDYRFVPIRREELGRLKVEISVLTLPREVRSVDEIEVGRHGLVISKGMARGLLLPQVPTEYNWNRETFLRHCCLKAGLDEREWKRGAKIEVFEAQVFSEEAAH